MIQLLGKIMSRISNFLQKHLHYLRTPLPVRYELDDDAKLEQLFTNAEDARRVFEQLIYANQLSKQLLLIHGIGGLGKTTLLKMYSLFCRRHHLPVASVSAEEDSSPAEILTGWADNLKREGVEFSTFYAAKSSYDAIQTKVEQQLHKMQDKRSRRVNIASVAVSKTSEAAIGAAAGAVLGSVVPGVGTVIGTLLGGIVGSIGADAFTEWLYSFLSNSELEFYLDPTKRITHKFLDNLAPIATNQRVVLMIDTYEQLPSLDGWVCDLAQQLPDNVLLVIASRGVPEWNRTWQGWIDKAEIVELKEMKTDEMRLLVLRYYAYLRGSEPKSQDIETIVKFARGLPIAAVTVVDLWAKFQMQVSDFQSMRPKVVADLVEQLLTGIPEDIRLAVEAAAVLRYFTYESLQVLLESSNAKNMYRELQRWPFIRPRREGFAVHDAMREMINEALSVDMPLRFCTLHERAAEYYKARLAKAIGEEREHCILERLYHLLQSRDESTAIMEAYNVLKLARGFYRRQFAETILTTLDQYVCQPPNRYWLVYLRYLVARLDPHIGHQLAAIKNQLEIIRKLDVEPSLFALMASELADAPGESNISSEERIRLAKMALDNGFLPTLEIPVAHLRLALAYKDERRWEDSIKSFERAISLFEEQGNPHGTVWAANELAYCYLFMSDWGKSITSAKKGIALSHAVGGYLYTNSLKVLGWSYTYSGELNAAMEIITEALKLAQERTDEAEVIRLSRRLAEIYDRQKQWSISTSIYRELITRDEKLGRVISRATLLTLLGISYLNQGLLKDAEQSFLESLPYLEVPAEPLAFNGLGNLYLKLNQLDTASKYFERLMSVSKGRPYYLMHSVIGLLQVDISSSKFSGIPEKVKIITAGANYGYHDHLAKLALMIGHLAWDGHLYGGERKFDTALYYYQHSLIYALRYNRFLLDEVLSQRLDPGPLQSIIPYCLQRRDNGYRMLMALQDWWGTSTNNVSEPLPETTSILRKGISLLEAEGIARQREPGDGTSQSLVMIQLEQGLT